MEDYSGMVREYNSLAQNSASMMSVRDFGVEELDGMLKQGYRVMVRPGETLRYPVGDEGVAALVSPERTGEILEIDLDPSGDEPYLSELIWHGRDKDPGTTIEGDFYPERDRNNRKFVQRELGSILVFRIITPQARAGVDRNQMALF